MRATAISKPLNDDVLFEKGLRAQNHPGNVLYRRFIKDKAVDYDLAETRHEKDMVAHYALKKVRGRFLTKHEDGMYYIVSQDIALAKVKQALRDRRKEATKAKAKETSSKVRSDIESKAKNVKRIKRTSGDKSTNRGCASSSEINSADVKRLLQVCMNL